jgi:long-chain acyl-CoA synthetase
MITNLAKSFQKGLIKNENKKILGIKENKKWKWIDKKKMNNMINYAIEQLKDHNIKKNDRVIYKGNNSPNWVAWNIATNSLGAIWVPLYNNQKDDYCKFIINNCKGKLLISDNNIKFDGINSINNKIEDFEFQNEFSITHHEIATLIYTSGTTGNPKGVMLSHKNLLSNIEVIDKRFSDFRGESLTSLNILPWAHIYGMTTELYYNFLNDNKVAICSGKENFLNECREIKPDILYLVPKVLETIKCKLQILDKPLINHLLPFILRRLFGGNITTIFMGGAKLDNITRDFYLDNNIIICEGYGCSETSPMISVNHIVNPRNINSVGKVLDDIIVEIIDNEICVNGPNVMKGYWGNNKATTESFIYKNSKRFYKTGDAGYIENDYLYVTGRISENYKLSNGKFVNVADIESKIKQFIPNNFIIYGENMDSNILIIEKPFDNFNILDKINSEIDSYLKIKEILLVDDFSDYLTPKMSIKRKKLINNLKETNKIK